MARICFISLSAYGYFNENAPAGGGAQRQFHLLSTHLTDHYDVHFIVGDYGQPVIEHHEGVTLHRSYSPDSNASPKQRIDQLIDLSRALHRADSDVYIARCFPRKLAVLYPLLTLLRRPLIFHVAGDPFVEKPVSGMGSIRRPFYYQALKNVASVIAQTEYQAERLQQYWGITAPIIPNGYPQASVVDTYDTREYFLWVGRLDKEQKRPHIFLNIATKYPNQNFVLVGPAESDNEYTRSIRARAESMENVTYTGSVNPDEIHSYYRKAIALINTSAYEGFPNTFLESWRYGTPVVSLAIDTSRFLEKKTTLTGYADKDMSKLEDLIGRLAESRRLRRRLGITGLQTFTNKYQIETTVDMYCDVIDDIVDIR